MTINVFEGARRIELLPKVAFVIVCIVVVWSETPYVSLSYETRGPSAPFVKAPGCGTLDAQEHPPGYKLEDGKEVYITLCFKAQSFPNGSMLVPYKEDGGQLWGNIQYSSEVTNYTEARAKLFTLSEEGPKAALEEWRKGRRSQVWSGLGWAVGGWIAISVVGLPSSDG